MKSETQSLRGSVEAAYVHGARPRRVHLAFGLLLKGNREQVSVLQYQGVDSPDQDPSTMVFSPLFISLGSVKVVSSVCTNRGELPI